MTRYRQTVEFLRRPLAVVLFTLGVFLVAEAIWLGRGAAAYLIAIYALGSAVVTWLVPSGRRVHPPSESTLQWARKQRRG